MNSRILIAASAALLLTFAPALAGHSEAPPVKPAPCEYTLMRVSVAETKPVQYLWVLRADQPQEAHIDNQAFQTLDSPTLRAWLHTLPAGTAIHFTPSSLPLIGRRFDTTEVPVREFAEYCRTQKLQFGYNPTL